MDCIRLCEVTMEAKSYQNIKQYVNIKKVNIAICDDEEKILGDIHKLICNHIEGTKISLFSGGINLLKALKENQYDILLLDIDMPDMSGLEIAKTLADANPKPLVIFVTSHDELVYDSLQFHPFGFVRKSYMESELPKGLYDAVQEINSRERHFHFRSGAGDIILGINDILYFEADGNYIKVFTADEEYRFRETMQALENTMNSYGFVRIHKGFLVNQTAVKIINADECTLTDDCKLPVGRSYSEEARKKFMRYMLK